MKSEDNGDRLAAALVENDRLRSENERLRKLLRVREVCPEIISASEMETLSPATPPLAADEKIRLFRSLFRGREDIYAVRWEGKNGKAGYSPAHIRRGWFASKAEARANREFLPLTDAVIRDHLSGKLTAGVYPLLKDETCWFLAADFDKTTWQDDTTAFLQTCSQSGVPAYLERSRSGGGAHVWIFFEQATTASLARKLGAAMLTRTMESRHQIGLDSYDRLFPNQDTMPQAVLATDRTPAPTRSSERRQQRISGDDFCPIPDQWSFSRWRKGSPLRKFTRSSVKLSAPAI